MGNLVSVIIPFYSNITWLEEAVNSVLCQSYKDYEIIVVNDGSKEEDKAFLIKYGSRINYFKTKNRGPGAARNYGIDKATGDYIAFLDSDDLWLPSRLEVQVNYMLEHNAVWSHCSYVMFSNKTNKNLKKVRVGDFYGDLFLRLHLSSPIATPCVIIKNNVLQQDPTLRFAEQLRYGQDSYLWRLLNDKYPLYAIDEILVNVRVRGTNAARRARVQLQSRANTYEYIKLKQKDKDIRYQQFPKFPLFLFFLSHISFKILMFFERKIHFNNNATELISKILYAPIYIGLKTYNLYLARKEGKKSK